MDQTYSHQPRRQQTPRDSPQSSSSQPDFSQRRLVRSNRMNYIRFDVGHHLFTCHKDTLFKFPQSFLAKLVEPQFDTRDNELDYITIDRDGSLFDTILNYMRNNRSFNPSEWSDHKLSLLRDEADFYGITCLVNLCDIEASNRDRHGDIEVSPRFMPSRRLEIIFEKNLLNKIITANSPRNSIVISNRSIRRFAIHNWIEKLITLCDHDKFSILCYEDKPTISQPPSSGSRAFTRCLGDEGNNHGDALTDFIMSLYEPSEANFTLKIPCPSSERFKERRAHYKNKLFEHWLFIQTDPSYLRKRNNSKDGCP